MVHRWFPQDLGGEEMVDLAREEARSADGVVAGLVHRNYNMYKRTNPYLVLTLW